MRINAEFDQRAAIAGDEVEWVHSSESGVDRIMLDRIGAEVARATSVVRYAPNSAFPRHGHAKGEEFFVLEGVFSDETGDYPAGHYVRNPPGSGHTPFSKEGCRIFVKLRQFDDNDLSQFAIDTRDARAWVRDSLLLHEYERETVRVSRLEAGSELDVDPVDSGTELFVLSGRLSFDGREWPEESWLRFPVGDRASLRAVEDALVWIKTGHLPPGSDPAVL